MRFNVAAVALAAAFLLSACNPVAQVAPQAERPVAAAHAVDRAAILEDLRILAAAEMDGRGTGTPGAALAREYIAGRFTAIGVTPLGETYEAPFQYRRRVTDEPREGINLVGLIEGREPGGPVMVVTAHYDHLGHCDGAICNGADDNASGVAAMLAIAAALRADPPIHDVYFAALDAEEVGLQGARALAADFPVGLERVALNVNLDMLAINEQNELVASGAYHYPFMRERVARAEIAEPVILIQGHDSPEYGPSGDWTMMSDHAAFHMMGVPFIYYGVDFHPHYHQPSDEFENVHQDFFVAAAQTALNAVRLFDAELEAILADRQAADAAREAESEDETKDG